MNTLGRDEALNTSPIITELPSLDPTQRSEPITIESNETYLEDLMLRTYMRILTQSATTSAGDQLKAAKDVATMLGKMGSTKTTVVNAQNAQINQLNDNPELLGHLRRAGQGIDLITHAETANIITSKGGQGA